MSANATCLLEQQDSKLAGVKAAFDATRLLLVGVIRRERGEHHADAKAVAANLNRYAGRLTILEQALEQQTTEPRPQRACLAPSLPSCA